MFDGDRFGIARIRSVFCTSSMSSGAIQEARWSISIGIPTVWLSAVGLLRRNGWRQVCRLSRRRDNRHTSPGGQNLVRRVVESCRDPVVQGPCPPRLRPHASAGILHWQPTVAALADPLPSCGHSVRLAARPATAAATSRHLRHAAASGPVPRPAGRPTQRGAGCRDQDDGVRAGNNSPPRRSSGAFGS
jgi:hypothetical protein